MLDDSPKSFTAGFIARRGAKGLVIDVGAWRGDYALELRALFPDLSLLLIEPTSEVAESLRARFESDGRAIVVQAAAADCEGRRRFYRYGDSTQNGLRPLVGSPPIENGLVPVRTIDAILADYRDLPPPLVLKIDTQGADLQVLEGARATISVHRPLVSVEMIFASLYRDQCSPLAIWSFLDAAGYSLADIVMPHVDGEGRLAFSDWVFSPDPPVAGIADFSCRDACLLATQLRMFRTAAAERLALIERLSAECEARLRIIEEFKRHGTGDRDNGV